jgi:hypothetical protein
LKPKFDKAIFGREKWKRLNTIQHYIQLRYHL